MFRSTHVSAAWYKSHQNKPLTNPMRRWVPLKMTIGALGLIFGSIPASYHYYGNQVTEGPNQVSGPIQQANMLTVVMVEMLPWNYVSRYCGGIANHETLPHWVHQWMIAGFVWAYDIRTTINADRSADGDGEPKLGVNLLKDPVQAAKLKEYKTLQEFFIRSRDQEPEIDRCCPLVAPCDATLLQVGECKEKPGVKEGRGMEKLIQAKGVHYSLTNLLRTSDIPPPPPGFSRYFWTFYLEPGAYHRFHCPADELAVDFTVHVPGHLYPVTPKAAKWLPNLYIGNERVNVIGTYNSSSSGTDAEMVKLTEALGNDTTPTENENQQTSSAPPSQGDPKPLLAMSLVGAANVGCIELDIDQRIQTNPDLGFGDFSLKRDYNLHTPVLKKGAEVGRFKLGSSIVLVADIPEGSGRPTGKIGDKVQIGAPLLGFLAAQESIHRPRRSTMNQDMKDNDTLM